MTDSIHSRIRRIFLSPRPNTALLTAASLLGMTFPDLRREVETGSIVAVPTPLGLRVPREEMITAAMRLWEQSVIEAALGDDAPRILPEALRLVELRARVPRYQRDMLHYLAQRDGTNVDHVLTRELEDLACVHAEELRAGVPGFALAMGSPARGDEFGSCC